MIEVHGLTKRYGATTAVRDLTFTAKPGYVTAFLGPNGSGKSTTMRVLLGLDRPTSGSATISGRPLVQRRHPLRHVGALLDASAVAPGRRALDHLTWLAHSNGLPRRRAREVLDAAGLTDVARRRVVGFSLGMRQRLGIAAALLGDPAVLLLDEPVNGLDPDGVRWIRELMRSLADEGRTVLLSSHLMAEVAQVADRLVVVGRGRLIADTSVRELVEQEGAVLVGSPRLEELRGRLAVAGARVEELRGGRVIVTGMTADRIAELTTQNEIPVHEITPQRESLEDAYLRLTAGHVNFAGKVSTR